MLPYRLTMHPVVRAARRPWKVLEALVANVVFGFPSRRLRVIGVTGTTGKTTTIHLTVVALESAGYTVGAISSIAVQVGTAVARNETGLSTLGPWKLQKMLARMARAGCHYAVIEVTSHALDQRRLWGVEFDVAVMATLSRDHLDYHGTMEDYVAAKRRLFAAVSRRPRKVIGGKDVPRVLIASLDDPRTRAFLEDFSADAKFGLALLDPVVPTPPGTEPVHLYAIRVHPDKTTGVVLARGRNALLHLRLAGAFNVRNAGNAIAVGVSQGIPPARITRELMEVRSIPGRFERVDAGQPFTVIIDYAVDEVALKALYDSLRAFRPARVLAVFGACGDRDRGKRPIIAEIVARYADRVFLTEEDPYTEDPARIFADLEAGLKKGGCVEETGGGATNEGGGARCVYVKIPDRRAAIRAAIRHARPGDLIVATGKGAERSIHYRDHAAPWDERAVFEDELRKKRGEVGERHGTPH